MRRLLWMMAVTCWMDLGCASRDDVPDTPPITQIAQAGGSGTSCVPARVISLYFKPGAPSQSNSSPWLALCDNYYGQRNSRGAHLPEQRCLRRRLPDDLGSAQPPERQLAARLG